MQLVFWIFDSGKDFSVSHFSNFHDGPKVQMFFAPNWLYRGSLTADAKVDPLIFTLQHSLRSSLGPGVPTL